MKSLACRNLIILLSIILLLCSSCTNKTQQELASTDTIREIEENVGTNYIINKRTGKVHSYTHGTQIIENKDNILETNDSLENILKNENYDICRTCWAGLRKNLSKYRNEDFNLIEKFMRLYDFNKEDEETQKFLMCIFEVGEWYVDNVYTYQGGKQTVIETENTAKKEASNKAYDRWRNYLDNEYYNKNYGVKNEKRILPVVYDNNGKPTTLVTYRCDLFKNANYGKGTFQKLKNAEDELIDEEYKNYCVIDDCSKFAAAVYYHYINKELLKNEYMDDKLGYGIDLWGTNTEMFSRFNSFIKKLTGTKKFEFYTWNDSTKSTNINKDFILQIGDLIYRKNHIEFYIGNNKVIGWGRLHKSYTINKTFHFESNGLYSNDESDKNLPYTAIIRLRRSIK